MPAGKVLGRPRPDCCDRMHRLSSRHLLNTTGFHFRCRVYLVLGRKLVKYARSLVSRCMQALCCGQVLVEIRRRVLDHLLGLRCWKVFGAHWRVVRGKLHIVPCGLVLTVAGCVHAQQLYVVSDGLLLDAACCRFVRLLHALLARQILDDTWSPFTGILLELPHRNILKHVGRKCPFLLSILRTRQVVKHVRCCLRQRLLQLPEWYLFNCTGCVVPSRVHPLSSGQVL
jgi:hypothetical protein